MAGKLVDLKRTKADKKENKEHTYAASPMDEDYNYGTRLHLGDHELNKLSMDENPEVGSEHHFLVKAKVRHASEDQDESGKRRRVELQITHMTPSKHSGKSVRESIKDSMKEKDEE